MIQNMVLGGSGGGDAEIKTLTATVSDGGLSFSLDGIPTWFLLYAESANRPKSGRYHLVMAYGEVDLTDSGEGYSYGQSTNCCYISYYGAVRSWDDERIAYIYENNGTFYLEGYDAYYRMPENAVYNLCYTT